MRVAVLFEYDSLNGGELSWLASVPFLRSRGVELLGIAPKSGPLAEALSNAGVEHVAWPAGVRDEFGHKRSQDAIRSQVREIAARLRPDLLHANSLSMARTLGPIGIEMGVPRLGHLRDILRLNPTVIRDLNGNDCLLAVSNATKNHHVAQGLDAARTDVLYNGVDLNTFRPGKRTGAIHRELGLPTDARLILTIGQIGLRKAVDVGMHVMRDLFVSDSKLHWLIVGQRHSSKAEAIEYEQGLLKSSRELPFEGRVHWLGRRSDVPQLMRECTIVLHLARQEPLGRVLLEAAASGAVVVASDVGGTGEVFRGPDGSLSAMLVLPDAAESTVFAMKSVLEDAELRQQLGQAARDRAVKCFSAEKAAEGLYGHYCRVSEGR